VIYRFPYSVSGSAGREGIGSGVVIEHGVSSSSAIREPLTVLHHEVHVDQIARHGRIREELVRFRSPVDLSHRPGPGFS
jgi:hypothetical protein